MSSSGGEALRAELERRTKEAGFVRFGVARAEPLAAEGEHLARFIRAGRHGQMRWLEETAAVRADPQHREMLPSAKSIVVLAAPYARREGVVGPRPLRVARYARGRDYHNVLGKPLKKLAKLLRSKGYTARVSVDTMPVLERAWAARAGIGFIGKNCCLIVPGLGSHVFLATILTSAELPVDAPMPERCGECRLCLDACPTSAFVRERELDARRCISYLTIEHDGAIDEPLRDGMGDWAFGCDVCQDVCPFNRTALPPDDATAPFAAHARLDLEAPAILEMDDDAYRAWAEGSPLRRPSRDQMARNVCIALGNSGDRAYVDVLERTSREDRSATVREAARWAAKKLSR